jgi:cytidine deaminase
MPGADERIAGLPIVEMSVAAWGVRHHARLVGRTAVGCAALDESMAIHIGCNIEHRFRSHDIHAEVCATSALVASGAQRLVAVLIAAERERFTPCGACMDWIFELGGGQCIVMVQRDAAMPPEVYAADQLMPHYPY